MQKQHTGVSVIQLLVFKVFFSLKKVAQIIISLHCLVAFFDEFGIDKRGSVGKNISRAVFFWQLVQPKTSTDPSRTSTVEVTYSFVQLKINEVHQV